MTDTPDAPNFDERERAFADLMDDVATRHVQINDPDGGVSAVVEARIDPDGRPHLRALHLYPLNSFGLSHIATVLPYLMPHLGLLLQPPTIDTPTPTGSDDDEPPQAPSDPDAGAGSGPPTVPPAPASPDHFAHLAPTFEPAEPQPAEQAANGKRAYHKKPSDADLKAAYRNGIKTGPDVAAYFNVPESTAYRWLREARNKGLIR